MVTVGAPVTRCPLQSVGSRNLAAAQIVTGRCRGASTEESNAAEVVSLTGAENDAEGRSVRSARSDRRRREEMPLPWGGERGGVHFMRQSGQCGQQVVIRRSLSEFFHVFGRMMRGVRRRW